MLILSICPAEYLATISHSLYTLLCNACLADFTHIPVIVITIHFHKMETSLLRVYLQVFLELLEVPLIPGHPKKDILHCSISKVYLLRKSNVC